MLLLNPAAHSSQRSYLEALYFFSPFESSLKTNFLWRLGISLSLHLLSRTLCVRLYTVWLPDGKETPSALS